MQSSDWSKSTVLAEWAERECRHLDLIASWETLTSIYETLRFTGPDNDDTRLAEFKTVITELNKFLTRMKNGLSNAKSIEESIEFLSSHSNTTDMNGVRTRSSVAYNKLKQRWIGMAIFALETRIEMMKAQEGERDD
jgi:hypothetical protein